MVNMYLSILCVNILDIEVDIHMLCINTASKRMRMCTDMSILQVRPLKAEKHRHHPQGDTSGAFWCSGVNLGFLFSDYMFTPLLHNTRFLE